MKYILFTGGGSAGHVTPNLAIMEELRRNCRIGYMGTGGIERELVHAFGCPFLQVDCPKLVRAITLKNLAIPARLRRACRTAHDLLRQDPPDLVFSKGGYASFPAVWAAHRLGVPVLTHESDLSPGLCTRLVAKKCRRVLTSFPETAEHFANGKYVGSPIRGALFGHDRAAARRKYGFMDEKPVLLVLGGGSGSRTLNEAVARCRGELLPRFSILQLCGKGNAGKTETGWVQLESEQDMGSAYACADLVLARAGSNTIFELLALKKPALLVPLARCSRGDQQKNAAYFAQKSLCAVLEERELDTLPHALLRLYGDAAIRSALAATEIGDGTPGVLEEIADALRSRVRADSPANRC